MTGQPAIGEMFAGCLLEDLAGRGGMGVVYRARQVALDRPVAVKLIAPELAGDPAFRERFQREARITASLDHANVIPVHEAGEEQGRLYLVMKDVDGTDLRALIAHMGRLAPAHAASIVFQVAAALDAAHARGLVHRDVKPANVLLTGEPGSERVYLADFGLSKEAASAAELTSTGQWVGTLAYVAPEQIIGTNVDARADVYALGCVLYHALTGKLPFERDSTVATIWAKLNEAAPLPSATAPGVPAAFDAVVARALAKDPADRYPSAGDLARAALAAVADRPGALEPERTVAAGAAAPRAHEIAAPKLPARATSLIGRRDELRAVCDLVRRDAVRLVTLTGPGGIGKTRLALEAAHRLASEVEDGAVFVELAALRDPGLVVGAVADALSIRETGDTPVREMLERYLHERRLLLVLDNFEHLLPAASDLAHLLAVAPRLEVIVTSRAVLRVSGEHEFVVPPLALPERVRGIAPESLSRYEAVALFVDRARAVKPTFQLSEASAPAVAEMCVRLDGIPLAIELAAARVKLLPPTKMLERLRDPLRFLTDGPRDLPARQQTLNATIDWSYRLLEEPERRLLRRLAVFAGGWTVEAAEALCDLNGDLGIDVLARLGSLVDKSLVELRDLSDEGLRFAMLGVIDEFASRELEASGDAALMRARHAHHFTAIAQEADAALVQGLDVEQWLRRLDAELANMRAVLAWADVMGDSDTLLKMAGALEQFWWLRGLLSEGRDWLAKALQGDEGRPSPSRARALMAAAVLASDQGDTEAATMHCHDSIAMYRDLGDLRGLGRATGRGGIYALQQGDSDRAMALWEKGIELLHRAADHRVAARYSGNLGYLALVRGDVSRATSLCHEWVLLERQLDDKPAIAVALQNLAFAELENGETLSALAHLEQSVQEAARLGYRKVIAFSLVGLAALASQTGNAELAAEALGVVDAWSTSAAAGIEPYERRLYDRTAAALRSRLGSDAFLSAVARGHARPLEELTEFAVRVGEQTLDAMANDASGGYET